MKFYVSGRVNRSNEVAEVIAKLKRSGHEVTFDWPSYPSLKPYTENQSKSAEFASAAVSGVYEADVYIFITHEDGHGIFVEFGAALAARGLGKDLRIYVVGMDRGQSMFYFHPAIEWFDTIEDVYTELGL